MRTSALVLASFLLLPALARADEPPAGPIVDPWTEGVAEDDDPPPPPPARVHEATVGLPQDPAVGLPQEPAGSAVVRSVETDADYSVTFRIGHDVTYAPAGDTDVPLLGNLEVGLVTENLPLGYLTLRSWHGGLGGTALLERAGAGGRRGQTQACYICVGMGWDLDWLTESNAGPLWPGTLTFGLHMDDVWVGTHLAYLAPTFGAEVGYKTRRGPWFAHVLVGVGEIIDNGARGERLKLEIDGYWRGLGPFAVYGRLGYAQGAMDYGDFTHSFGGPIMSVGLAYVSR